MYGTTHPARIGPSLPRSGATILGIQFSDSGYLWNLLGDDFECPRDRDFTNCDVVGNHGRCELIDAGQLPDRREHLSNVSAQVVTDDGTPINLPGA
jgi:hypothetical protein